MLNFQPPIFPPTRFFLFSFVFTCLFRNSFSALQFVTIRYNWFLADLGITSIDRQRVRRWVTIKRLQLEICYTTCLFLKNAAWCFFTVLRFLWYGWACSFLALLFCRNECNFLRSLWSLFCLRTICDFNNFNNFTWKVGGRFLG